MSVSYKTLHPSAITRELIKDSVLKDSVLKDSEISAFNDVQGITIETNVLEGLNCAVPGTTFLKLLKTINRPEVILDADENKSSLKIKFGRNRTQLAILPEEDFIYEFPKLEDAKTLEMSGIFLEASNLCLSSVSDVPGHPELNTLTVIIKNKTVSLYSTDNKTMSRVIFETNESIGDARLIVPAPFFIQLLELSTPSIRENGLTLKYNNKMMSVNFNNGTKISTMLMDVDDVMDFTGIFESEVPGLDRVLFTEPPEGLKNALERASVFSELKNQKIVNVDVKEKAIYLRAESALGNAADIIEFPIDLGNFSFGINPEVFLQAITRTNELALLPNMVMCFKKTAELEFTHLVSFAD